MMHCSIECMVEIEGLMVPLRCIFKAGLEQEIENLKKKLAACTSDNVNLQEELSEAYRIKGQLADLQSAEVAKNVEAEKQLKFFHGCVAAAFAEQDHSIMEGCSPPTDNCIGAAVGRGGGGGGGEEVGCSVRFSLRKV
ncbi:hypothetical protein ACFX15_030600 [Malus domestica]